MILKNGGTLTRMCLSHDRSPKIALWLLIMIRHTPAPLNVGKAFQIPPVLKLQYACGCILFCPYILRPQKISTCLPQNYACKYGDGYLQKMSARFLVQNIGCIRDTVISKRIPQIQNPRLRGTVYNVNISDLDGFFN